MQSKNIRQNWINYFNSKFNHLILPSASLIPDNPTLLLTNAGMVPFVPYFLGQKKPPSSRIVTVQKCVRVGGKDSDLENIGKTPRHLTFFEMLGNFSFGDYFKEEVIVWAWEILTQVYGFQPEELIVSIFGGDEKLGEDSEALEIWRKKIGMPSERIWKLGRKDNFWGPPGGISGPCGPCSEIYYAPPNGAEPIEIWNLVFMQYEQFEDGSLKPLEKPNIDTGAGLERLASILQKKENVFQTDLLQPIIQAVQNLKIDKSHSKSELATKIISDHLRCSIMLLSDGVQASNLGRGYILRMLIRRAARYGKLIGLHEPFLYNLAPTIQEIFAGAYPELEKNIAQIQKAIQQEEENFQQTIERGLKKFNDLINNNITGEAAFDLYSTYGFPIELTIDLAEEHGLTVDLETYEKEKKKHSQISNQNKFAVGFKINAQSQFENLPETEFTGYIPIEQLAQVCNQKSEKNSSIILDFEVQEEKNGKKYGLIVLDKTPFYAESGGQIADKGEIQMCNSSSNQQQLNTTIFRVEDVQKMGGVFVHKGEILSELHKGSKVYALPDFLTRAKIAKHHTATHLLHAALRKLLGQTVQQKGSLVNPDRLRFDFVHSKPLSKQEIKNIEVLVNQIIQQDYEVKTQTLSFEQAVEQGALAFFEDKYGDKVRVLSVSKTNEAPFSLELCGGTHVERTSEIGQFKVVSESAISSGIRRIEALVGEACLEYLQASDLEIEEIKEILKTPRGQLVERIKTIQEESKINQKHLLELEKQISELKAEKILSQVEKINGLKILISQTDSKALKEALDYLGNKLQENYILFLFNPSTLSYAAKISPNLKESFSAKDIIAQFASSIGGSGGGRPDYAQGGGGKIEGGEFEELKQYIITRL